MRKKSLLLLLAWALVGALPSGAAHNKDLYATIAGFVTPLIEVVPDSTVVFRNLDQLADHNFSTPAGAKICGTGPEPLECFRSISAGIGQTGLIEIHAEAPPGRYAFYCGIHDWMRGFITVLPSE